MQRDLGKRPRSFYFLAAFFAAFVAFLYGPMSAIFVLSFQGPTGGLTFPMNGVSLRWFSGSEVSDLLARVELDHDARMLFVELPQDRREHGDRINLLGRDLHRPADVPRAVPIVNS